MKTKVLFYCTKGKPYLFNRIIKVESDGYYTDIVPYDIEDEYLCGKIVCECEVDCEEIFGRLIYSTDTLSAIELEEKSCLSQEQIFYYLKCKSGYALRISNLKVFDKPMSVNQFKVRDRKQDKTTKELFGKNAISFKWLEKAPENMCKVYRLDNNGEYYDEYVLISVRPQWLCKILNGKKTIEVRKKILKGML